MKNIFCVKDNLDGFGPLIQLSNKLKAIQVFSDEINNENSPLSKHPENYTLYSIGTFDEETGNIVTKVEKIEEGYNCISKK